MSSTPGSMVYQVKTALEAIFTPGASRHADKRTGLAANRIYSINAFKTYLNCAVVFARWARETHHIARLSDVTPEMALEFVKGLHTRDLSHATVNKYVAALAKLDAGLRKVGWRVQPAPLAGKGLYGRHADARPEPFAPDEGQQIIAYLYQHCPDNRLAQAAEAAWRGGLRISEVAGLRVSEISEHGGVLKLDGHSTKGGRPRTVPLDREAQAFFAELRQRGLGHANGHVFRDRKGLVRELQRWVRRVCQAADIGHTRVHDFRAGYATQLYARLRAAGATDQQARWEVAQALGHGRTDVLKHYLRK